MIAAVRFFPAYSRYFTVLSRRKRRNCAFVTKSPLLIQQKNVPFWNTPLKTDIEHRKIILMFICLAVSANARY